MPDDLDHTLGPVLTLGAAVKATGVSRSTMQRRLRAGDIPGAHRDTAGGWNIPISGLIAAGLAPKVTPPDTEVTAANPADDIGARLAAAEQRAARAEAEVDALTRELRRADEHVADMRRALAMLDAGPVAQETKPKKRRRWNVFAKTSG